MTDLKRISRKRIAGWRMPTNTVYVGRGTLWGNPYRVDKFRDGLHYDAFKVYEPEIDRLHTFFYDDVSELSLHRKQAAKKAVDLYREHWLPLADIADLKAALAGKNLACWCPTDQPCHADVLLEIANQEKPVSTTPNPLQTKNVGVEQTDPRFEAAYFTLTGLYPTRDRRIVAHDAEAVLAAADAVDPLRQPGHRVEINGDDWTLQHPAECRPNMLACPLNIAVREYDVTAMADGNYTVVKTDEGDLLLTAELNS